MHSVLKIKDLNVSYNGAKVLADVSLEVAAGEILTVIGPNGAGKTTLFKALLGLIPRTGKVSWRPDVKIGYVPQRLEIETEIPLTVNEFFRLRGKIADPQKISEALNFVRLEKEILNQGFGEISVGQRQRVLIAWALLNDPNVLLFDEPTADIDVEGQESVYKTISRLNKETGLTAILISHDLHIVSRYASRVLCLNKKIICTGAPEEILKTENLKNLYGKEHHFYHHH